jgi:heptosyltransferase-3
MPNQAQLITSATASLIPRQLLEESNKILLIGHLAIGDYTYLQNYFEAFANAYPHLSIHLWIDEVRRTEDASAWPSLKKYSLYDWVAECPHFSRVYKETYSPELYERSIREARAENYPIVVSLAVLNLHRYVRLARRISPKGFIVAQRQGFRLLDIRKRLIYRKLDAHIPVYKPGEDDRHISDIYAGWFEEMFGISIPREKRFPTIDIPQKWLEYAKEQFSKWGFDTRGDKKLPVVFLNSFSKSADRSWPLERLIELIQHMRKEPAWREASFIINVVPEAVEDARNLFSNRKLERVALFSAEENFFQLPAILSKCDLVISVETAVMHLANAVHVPVIALMRQKNPEWVPIDVDNSTVIKVPGRDDWIDKITVDHVLHELLRIPKREQ